MSARAVAHFERKGIQDLHAHTQPALLAGIIPLLGACSMFFGEQHLAWL